MDVEINRTPVATTSAMVPVSWEISCNLCHGRPTGNVDDCVHRHDSQVFRLPCSSLAMNSRIVGTIDVGLPQESELELRTSMPHNVEAQLPP